MSNTTPYTELRRMIIKDHDLDIMRKRVPLLKHPAGLGAYLAINALSFLAYIHFFKFLEKKCRLRGVGPFISHLLVGIIVSLYVSYSWRDLDHIRLRAQDKGTISFTGYILPGTVLLVVPWTALIAHVAMIRGKRVLPKTPSYSLGIPCTIIGLLLYYRGFMALGFNQSLNIALIFPEDEAPVHSEIYDYIRHPQYAATLLISLGLALLSNTEVAFLAALVNLIPSLVTMHYEDSILANDCGEEHAEYIQRVPALFPRAKHWIPLLRYLVYSD